MHRQAITLLLAALAAESVVAAPSHGHMHHHAKKDAAAAPGWQDVDYSKLTYTSFSNGFGQEGAPAATAAPQANAAPAPAADDSTPSKDDSSSKAETQDTSDSSSSSSSSEAGSGPGKYSGKALNQKGSLGSSTGSSAGANTNEYVGNIGSPYGANFAMVDSKGDNQYTITLKNKMSSPRRAIIFNKIGSDGSSMTGFIPSANPPAIDIMIQPGQSQMVAVGANTQGALCDWTEGKVGTKPPPGGGYAPGAYDCAWGEFDFGDEKNGGHNGFDISNIISNKFGDGNGDCAITMTDTVTGGTASCSSHVYQTDDQSVNPDSTTAVPLNPGNVHFDVEFGS